MKVPLRYSDIFPESNSQIKEVLNQLNKEKLIQAVIFLSRSEVFKNANIITFIKTFFSSKNEEFATAILEKISKFETEYIKNLTIVTKPTCYRLFEKALSMKPSKNTSDNISETLLFKALLLINEELITPSKELPNLIKKGDRVSHAKVIFTSSLPTHDISNYILNIEFMTEAYKAIHLFKFLNDNPKLITTLNYLLKEFECKDSSEYLRLMFASVLPEIINENKTLHYLTYDRSVPTENQQFIFMEKIALSKFQEADTLDFITLRSKPLIKHDNSKFLVLSDIFLCQLIHNSLYFKLSDIYNKLKLTQSLGIDFRGFYCYEYSEKFLFYNVLNKIFSVKSFVQISGEQFENKKIEGLVDFYVRNGSKILLCESKNSLFPAKYKNSQDYNAIESVLKRNYHSDQKSAKTDKKAVLQLIESIDQILNKKISKIDLKTPANPRFYPVLISHNKHTETHGFNLIVNEWFQIELEKLQICNKKEIRSLPLTVINIDTLIYFQDQFQKKEFDLYTLIEKYHQFVRFNKKGLLKFKNLNDWENRLIPFSSFIFNYMNKRGKMKPPKIISDLIEELRE